MGTQILKRMRFGFAMRWMNICGSYLFFTMAKRKRWNLWAKRYCAAVSMQNKHNDINITEPTAVEVSCFGSGFLLQRKRRAAYHTKKNKLCQWNQLHSHRVGYNTRTATAEQSAVAVNCFTTNEHFPPLFRADKQLACFYDFYRIVDVWYDCNPCD